MARDRGNRVDVFQKEVDNMEASKQFLKEGGYDKTMLQLEFKRLLENYEDVIGQVKIITKISDRLQGKLDKTNIKLEEINIEIQDKNHQLLETIDALTKAKVGRRATTYAFLLTIILFVISEVLIEPEIEEWISLTMPDAFYGQYIGLSLKLVVAVLMKPLDMLLERYLMKRVEKKALKEQEQKDIEKAEEKELKRECKKEKKK